MGLFSDIYNTVARFFRPQEEQMGDPSKSVATNRLKLVLMQDRTNLTPRILEQMRGELIDLLSRYVELDKELLDLNFEQEGDQVALMLSIPVIRAKDEEEIDAAIKEREEMLKAVASINSSNENTEEAAEAAAAEEEEEEEEETETNDNKETVINDERTEEELAEAKKADAIAHELQDVQKIIKKKEKKQVSAPEEMNSNFKSDASGSEELTGSTSEG